MDDLPTKAPRTGRTVLTVTICVAVATVAWFLAASLMLAPHTVPGGR